MSSIELFDRQLLADWPYRVCLPHGVDLLQLARWVNAAKQDQVSLEFDVVVGEQPYAWSGSGAIELFSEIQRKCINDSLFHSYVFCKQPRSIMYFDMYSRFNFFAAELEVLRNLYPFSREIMWENFVLLQEEDDDESLAEVFQTVQSV